jgi:hypothetical protein
MTVSEPTVPRMISGTLSSNDLETLEDVDWGGAFSMPEQPHVSVAAMSVRLKVCACRRVVRKTATIPYAGSVIRRVSKSSRYPAGAGRATTHQDIDQAVATPHSRDKFPEFNPERDRSGRKSHGLAYAQCTGGRRMHAFVQIETDEETRWINLAAVARATLARHVSSNAEVLVLYFCNGNDDCTLRLEATSRRNTDAIKALKAALESASKVR